MGLNVPDMYLHSGLGFHLTPMMRETQLRVHPVRVKLSRITCHQIISSESNLFKHESLASLLDSQSNSEALVINDEHRGDRELPIHES